MSFIVIPDARNCCCRLDQNMENLSYELFIIVTGKFRPLFWLATFILLFFFLESSVFINSHRNLQALQFQFPDDQPQPEEEEEVWRHLSQFCTWIER